MKKLLPIIIGLVLILSMVCVVDAAAEDTTLIPGDGQQTSADTLVVFKISQGYFVTIPAMIEISSSSGKGYDEIKVDVDQIAANKYLNVFIENPVGDYYNETSNKWIMKLEDSTETIEFFVGVGRTLDDHISDSLDHSPLQPSVNKNGVISVHADQKDPHEVKIHCKIPGFSSSSVADYAGDYKGKLNFVVSIDSASKALGSGYTFNKDEIIYPNGDEVLYSAINSA